MCATSVDRNLEGGGPFNILTIRTAARYIAEAYESTNAEGLHSRGLIGLVAWIYLNFVSKEIKAGLGREELKQFL